MLKHLPNRNSDIMFFFCKIQSGTSLAQLYKGIEIFRQLEVFKGIRIVLVTDK